MLFNAELVKTEEIDKVNNIFAQIDNEFEPVKTVDEEQQQVETPVSQYITSLVSSQYAKSVENIENTKVGNKMKRKRSLQQVMQESFFYGANRYGRNFIA